MVRFFTSLIVTVVIITMALVASTPIASGQPAPVFLTCADYCNNQAICQCAKILGGAVRLTQCNTDSTCEDTCSWDGCGFQCVCTLTILSRKWGFNRDGLCHH